LLRHGLLGERLLLLRRRRRLLSGLLTEQCRSREQQRESENAKTLHAGKSGR
jgi:hypothetical protein